MTHPVLLQISEELKTQLDLLDAQQERIDSLKDTLLHAMVSMGSDCPNTLKVEWGQIQRVTKTEWEYRDRGVTEQSKVAEGAKKALAAAKKLLTGMENAAKAAGKAKVVSESVSLRIVRGDKG